MKKLNINISLIIFLSSFLLLFSPWVRAGNKAIPSMVLELAGLSLLFIIFFSGKQKGKISSLLWFIIIFIASIPLIYLIPLPIEYWQNLPGRDVYSAILSWVNITSDNSLPIMHSISIIQSQTLDATLVLIPLIGIFVTVLIIDYKNLMFLIYIFLFIVTLQALLGVLQFTSNNFYIFYEQLSSGRAQGSYPTSDHFSALMEMGLPVAIYLFHSEYSLFKRVNGKRYKLLLMIKCRPCLLYFFVVTLVFMASLFSASRSGIFLAILGIIILSLLSRNKESSLGLPLYFPIAILGGVIVFLLKIDFTPILNRFIGVNPLEDARGEIFKQSIIAIKHFFPVGSGPGTFPQVFPYFQLESQASIYVNNAHNDYLELFFETGLLGMVGLTLFLLAYIAKWIKVLKNSSKNRPSSNTNFLQIGTGVATLLLLLHAFTDFNFHIFSNMIYFSFLLGVFFRSNAPPPMSDQVETDTYKALN